MSNPRPTLADVAKLAGVSVSTASLAFSQSGPVAEATRQRVFTAAQQLKYAGPNPLGRQLRSGRSGIIGVVVGDELGKTFRDPVSIQVLDGLVSTLGALGLGVLLIPGTITEDGALDPLLETAAIDVGVFIWGTHPEDPRLIALQQRNIPTVIGEGSHIPGSPLVAIDDRAGFARLARALRDQGHERVTTVTLPFTSDSRHNGWMTPDDVAEITWAPTRNRLDGLMDAGSEIAGIYMTEASLIENGQHAAREILNPDNYADGRLPTAILAQSDLLAWGVILEARDMGFDVPGDISVAGFDGIELPWVSPEVLTSVRQRPYEKGTAMANATQSLLDGAAPEITLLPVDLIPGTTTRALTEEPTPQGN